MYNEIKIYITFGIIFFILDLYDGKDNLYQNCKNRFLTLTVLLMHHIIASFLYFGWLSNNKYILRIHLISIIFALFLQFENNLTCPSTDYVNSKGGLSRNNYLRDFLFFYKIKEKELYYYYVLLSFIISFYKLL